MKKLILFLSTSLIILGCESDNEIICDPLALDLSLSEESISWIPQSYFISENLVFINEQGETKEFVAQGIFDLSTRAASMGICGSDTIRQVRTDYEIIQVRFRSIDSIEISIELSMFPNGCDWQGNGFENMGDRLSVSMLDDKVEFQPPGENGAHNGTIGILQKILKLPENPEIDNCYQYFEEIQTINLFGTEYSDVLAAHYWWDLQRSMYFKRGIGIIGFVDANGITWGIDK